MRALICPSGSRVNPGSWGGQTARSIEGDPDSSVLAPDQMAGQMRSFGDQHETGRDFPAVSQINPRACGGDVANHAGECLGAKFDRSGDDHMVPLHGAPLGKTSTVGCSGFHDMEGAAAIRAAIGPYRVAFGTGHDTVEGHAGIALAASRFWEKRFGTHRGYIQAAVRESYPQNYVTALAMLFKINMGNQQTETRVLATK